MLALWNQFLMRFVWTAMWPQRWSEARRRLHNTPLGRAPQQGRRQVAVAGQSTRVRQVIVDWRGEVEREGLSQRCRPSRCGRVRR